MTENRLVNISIIFLGLVVFALVLREFQAFLRPLVLALILTLLLQPVIEFSKRRKGMFWVTIFLILIILGSGFIITGIVIQKEGLSISGIQHKTSDAVAQAESSIEAIKLGGRSIDVSAFVNPERISSLIGSGITKMMQGTGKIVSELVLAVIFLIFMIPSHRLLVRDIKKNLERQHKEKFQSALLEAEKSIRSYIATKTLISLGTGIATMVALWLFGSSFIVILGILTFILNFIPNIGSIAAVILAMAVFALMHGFGWGLFWLTIILIAIQMFFGNYLEPKITGQTLNISPIIIIISLFIWYWIWGIMGMILAVPLTSIIRIVLGSMESTKGVVKYMS